MFGAGRSFGSSNPNLETTSQDKREDPRCLDVLDVKQAKRISETGSHAGGVFCLALGDLIGVRRMLHFKVDARRHSGTTSLSLVERTDAPKLGADSSYRSCSSMKLLVVDLLEKSLWQRTCVSALAWLYGTLDTTGPE